MNKLFDRIRNKRIERGTKQMEESQEETTLEKERREGKALEEEYFEKQRQKAVEDNKKDYLLSEIQYKILLLMREHRDWNQTQIANELRILQPVVSKNMRLIAKNNPDLKFEIETFNKARKYKYYRL
jgi:hypothetical protein